MRPTHDLFRREYSIYACSCRSGDQQKMYAAGHSWWHYFHAMRCIVWRHPSSNIAPAAAAHHEWPAAWNWILITAHNAHRIYCVVVKSLNTERIFDAMPRITIATCNLVESEPPWDCSTSNNVIAYFYAYSYTKWRSGTVQLNRRV